ncbi:unnamed protein product [Didymodactylos carnosus]|uniref:Uncharacterized protein n=1 Tax=Didymodactylos carnosus TaxID=1234261 RepID=A0A815GG88_9BILA|nr:unnamed protein product [Didymodactylos carnosus]CAF1338248.1 unnamed protein product [Didymodactylos carnosus]CAF3981888.1 unnamed protein product [Didymodactylos carnosus]CAF4197176.1 unnamed protein product [Didymodactylos carnosus]
MHVDLSQNMSRVDFTYNFDHIILPRYDQVFSLTLSNRNKIDAVHLPIIKRFTNLTTLILIDIDTKNSLESLLLPLESLQIVKIPEISSQNLNLLNVLNITSLTVIICDINIFYYLNSTIKSLTVQRFSNKLDKKRQSAIVENNLTYLDITLEQRDWSDIEFILQHLIGRKLKHFLLKTNNFSTDFDLQTRFLSWLNDSCNIEVFIEAGIGDHEVSIAKFQNYYDIESRTFCIHSLPYPLNHLNMKWCKDDRLNYDRVKRIKLIIDKYYQNYKCNGKFPNVNQIEFSMHWSIWKTNIDQYSTLIDQLFFPFPLHNIQTLKLDEFKQSRSKRSYYSEQLLFEMLKRMPNLKNLTFFPSRNLDQMVNVLERQRINKIEEIEFPARQPTDVDLSPLRDLP